MKLRNLKQAIWIGISAVSVTRMMARQSSPVDRRRRWTAIGAELRRTSPEQRGTPRIAREID